MGILERLLDKLRVDVSPSPESVAYRGANADDLARDITRLFEAEQALPRAPANATRRTWQNCVSDQSVQPLRFVTAADADALRAIVDDARARKLHVRVAGGGHAFSDLVRTTGVLVDTCAMNAVERVDPKTLRASHANDCLVRVGAGARIAEVNAWLDAHGLGLENMGSYDGQAIVGAITTGTHGSGITLGPLASQVVAIVVVGGDGRVYQIEPSNGVTDPAAPRYAGVDVLKQDDDWFFSAVVGLGTIGVAASVTLRVVPQYALTESRRRAKWSDVKDRIADGTALAPRHYEVLVNPYRTVDGDHSCLETIREIAPLPQGPVNAPELRHALVGLLEGSRLASEALLWFLGKYPTITPHAIDRALDLLEIGDDGYVDVSHKVFNLGPANGLPAVSTEIAVPLAKAVVALERVFQLAESAASFGNVYLTSPVGVRFVAASPQYLAMQHGEAVCTIEMPILVGTVGGLEMLERFEEAMRPLGGRPHWGQIHHVSGAGDWLAHAYPKIAAWRNVRRAIDPDGVFSNAFTDRCGL